jgi:hypothetical protein
MSWNYRVLVFGETGYESIYRICEVYYDKNNNPTGYIEEKLPQSTEGISGLKWYLEKQLEALEKPILHGGEKFPQEYKP